MSTIFISHSSRDNAAAKELESRLSRQGHHSVFLDLDPEKGIVAGASWEQTLYRKLRACRSVIALVSDNYLSSRWCFAEIALARMEGKHLFALKIDQLGDAAKLPSILTEKQFIDLRYDPEDGYRRLWRGLDEQDLMGKSSDWNPADAPYLGLNSYQEKHAAVFFGRENESRACVELLDRGSPGLIMTLGASGSGKSSLVKAGVIPRLRRYPERWIILEPVRPGKRPFNELAESVSHSYRRYTSERSAVADDIPQLEKRLKSWSSAGDTSELMPGELTEDDRVQRLMRQLEELHLQPPTNAAGSFLNFLDWSLDDLRRICGDASAPSNSSTDATVLTEIGRDLQRLAMQSGARVLLLIDQFEELLTQPDEDTPHHQECHDFLEMIRQTIEADGSPITVLATMRSDFLGSFQRHPVLGAIDFESLSVGPVTSESMRKIIEAPARLGAIRLEDGLTDRLLEDTETADALPLLSFTLWVMWRDFRDDGALSLLEYEKLGALQGAISREADALIEGHNQTAVREAFLELTRISEHGEFTRRLVDWENLKLQPVHDLLEQFIDKRLLMTRAVDGERTIEVAHEALFRSWTPLKNWLRDNSQQILFKQEIERDAKSWVAASRSNDNLWRGSRLLRAKEQFEQSQLTSDSEAFINAGVRKRRIRLVVYAGLFAVVFSSMAGLTYNAMQSKARAQTTGRLALEFAESSMQEGDSVPGTIEFDRQIFKPRFYTEKKRLITGQLIDNNGGLLGGAGTILALAHPKLFNNKDPSPSFLKYAIQWTIPNSRNLTIASTTGHCETVDYDGDFPSEKSIELLGHTAIKIKNLIDSSKLQNIDLLIIGDAWAEFETEEIESVRQFVVNGGTLFLTGLFWSWEYYSQPEVNEYNPCIGTSKDRKLAQDEFPMNTLGKTLGLRFE